MGVQPPEVEDFQEEPKTPPGLQGHDNEDDLFFETGTTTTTTNPVFTFDHDIDFRSILPAKGVFEDFLGVVDHWYVPNEKKKYCGKCFEDVKRDLKKLVEVVDSFRNERDVARKETEVLKNEVEELKRLMKKKEETEKGIVTINITNGKDNFDVLVKSNSRNEVNNLNSDKKSEKVNKYGIISFSITPKSSFRPLFSIPNTEPKTKKTIAELRRDFFAKEFESQQNTFTSYNYLEIQPEEKKETFRSKLNIRVKPRKKISELISKLTSKIGAQKVIPDPTPICMFQRFEKTKTVWVNEFEEKSIA